eukprot:g8406.t1
MTTRKRKKTSTAYKNTPLGKLGQVNFQTFKKAQMLKHLEALYASIKDRHVSGAIPELSDFALPILASSAMIQHKQKDVRVLTAGILTEVLRVVAPNKPKLKRSVMKGIFNLIIQQIRGVPDMADSAFPTRCRILQVFAEDSLGVLLVEDFMESAKHSESMVVDLFDAVLTSIHPRHSQGISAAMGQILCTCLDEMEDGGIPESVLDVLLRPLIKELRNDGELQLIDGEMARVAEQPRSFKLVRMIISHCLDSLVPSIVDFINSTLVSTSVVGEEKSEIRKYVHPLIYELHLICRKKNFNILLSIMPNLGQQLQAEDENIRLRTVALLGKLFAEFTHLARDHQAVFQDWLGRFLDKSPQVRKEMVIGGVQLQRARPELQGDILPRVVEKLLDIDVDVRFQAVDKLCTLAFYNVMLLPKSALRRIINRMDDKKTEVSRAATVGLAKVFAAYISNIWPQDWDPTLGSTFFTQFSNNITERVLEIPGALVQTFARPNRSPAQQMTTWKMFDQVILPKGASLKVRAEILVSCYRSFSRDQRDAFISALKFRGVVRKQVKKMVALREDLKKALSSAADAPAGADKKKRSVQKTIDVTVGALANNLPGKNGKKHFATLLESKDQTIFRSLVNICTSSISYKDAIASRDYILGRLGSKTPLGQYFKSLFSLIIVPTVSAEKLSFGHIARIAKECNDDNDEGKALDVLQFIGEVTCDAEMPDHLEWALKYMTPLLSSEHVDIAQSVLRTLAKTLSKVGSHVLSKYITSSVIKTLIHIGKNGVADHAKYATRILATIQQPKSKTGIMFWNHYIRECMAGDSLSIENEHLDAVLMSFAVCAESLPNMIEGCWDKINSFVKKHCTPRQGEAHSSGSQQPSVPTSVVVSAIKWLGNSLINSPLKGSRPLFLREGERVMSSMRRFVRDSEHSAVRLAAGNAVLKCARRNEIEAVVDARTWQVLGQLVKDKDEYVRDEFCERVKKACCSTSKRPLGKPTKYGALLVLRGLDEDISAKSDAQKQISEILNAAKRVFFQYAKTPNLPDHTLDLLRNLYRPESLVVYAAHLIAHYYGRKDDEKYSSQRRLINFLLKSFPSAGFYNFSYLMELLRCVDNSDDVLRKTKYTRTVAELMILTMKSKSKSSKKNEFGEPEKFKLPPNLFRMSENARNREPLLEENFLEKLKKTKAKTPSTSEKKRKSTPHSNENTPRQRRISSPRKLSKVARRHPGASRAAKLVIETWTIAKLIG